MIKMALYTCILLCVISWANGHKWRDPPKFPFQDPTLSWDKRADDLVSRLTLEEIVPQTLAVYGGATPAIERLNIKPYIWITECLHGQVATNTTAFPQSIGLAAAFSPDLLERVAEAISIEVRAQWNGFRRAGIYKTDVGLSCFSPVINIMRHPLWGRNQETYGEDPYLSGSLVQGYVRGLQGQHPRYVRANAGCKHFDVHGGPENIPASRFDFDAKVSMRDWRMTFLPAFKMCVDAGSYSLMCSYNSVNGIPACAHKQLLTDITRTEWGFKGYVVSDAGAVSNIISYHHYLKNTTDTAAACIKAGCNLELGSNVYKSQIDAMKAGLLTEKDLRDNVRPLMMMRLRLGEWDPEEMNPYNAINMSVVQSVEHRNLSLESAMKSFVLLKNDGLLPLKKKYKKLAVVGPFAKDRSEIFGDYPSSAVGEYTKSVAEGLVDLADMLNATSGCNSVHCDKYTPMDVQMAVSGADLIVVALGTGSSLEEEGNDRANIDLPGSQLQLLQDAVEYASTTSVPIILLLFNAGPLDVTWAKLHPRVSAILECFFPGQSTGDAVSAVLKASAGSISVPAARLPSTWPSHLAQVPPITDYNMTGHTYRYYTPGEVPLYPFGYGLSYTSFLYTSAIVSTQSVPAGHPVTLTVGILNSGAYDADEVVQVYLEWTNASSVSIPVPKLQLVAYKRQLVVKNQHILVDLTIDPERLAVWGDQGWTYIKGLTTLYIGGQQPYQRTLTGSNVLKASFNIV